MGFPTKKMEFGISRTEIDIPIIDHLDARILREVEKNVSLFDMAAFSCEHSCGTAHCVAGWAIVVAGLEHADRRYGIYAGTLARAIYRAAGLEAPTFASAADDEDDKEWNDDQLDALRARAAADPLPPEKTSATTE